MEDATIKRLRENIWVFEHMAMGLQLRLTKATDSCTRARVERRVGEIALHVAQLRAKLDEVAGREKISSYAQEQDRSLRQDPGHSTIRRT